MASRGNLKIAQISGIPVYIHWTFWFLIAWILVSSLLTLGFSWIVLAYRLLTVLGLVVSVILHEFGHAWAARLFGIRTRDITMYPFGGVASIEKIPQKPLHELVIAIAGPAVNFLITGVIVSYLLLIQALPWPLYEGWDLNAIPFSLIGYLHLIAQMNVILALFNLLPAFPMDGGRVLRAFLAMRLPYVKATQIAANVGQAFAVLFAFLGILFNPVLILIAFFIWVAASQEKNVVEERTSMESLIAKDALMLDYPKLEATETIADAIQRLLSSQARAFLVLDPMGVPVGSLSREQLIQALHEGHPPQTPITHIMSPRLIYVVPHTPLYEVLEKIQEENVPFVLVQVNGHLGLIDAENIAEYLLIRKAISQQASQTAPA